MNRLLPFRCWLVIGCLLCLSAGFVLAAGEDAAYIYGKPPTTGDVLLKLVNNENSLDILAVITNGGDKTPLFAIYIPSDDVGSIKKMEKGRYDVYFTTGIDWNEDNLKFNDGNYYKIKTPLIIGDKTEYQIQLYADPGKMGARIKQIDESVFPEISGASSSSSQGNFDYSSNSGDKSGAAPPKS